MPGTEGVGGIWAQEPLGLGLREPSTLANANPQFLHCNVMVCISARGHPLLLAVSLLPLQPHIRLKQVPTVFAHHIREKWKDSTTAQNIAMLLSIPVAV